MASTKVLLILAVLVAVAWTLDTANPAIVDSQDMGMAQSTILETISADLTVAEHKKKKYRGYSGGGGGSSEERR